MSWAPWGLTWPAIELLGVSTSLQLGTSEVDGPLIVLKEYLKDIW
jgi:hypothetical protein